MKKHQIIIFILLVTVQCHSQVLQTNKLSQITEDRKSIIHNIVNNLAQNPNTTDDIKLTTINYFFNREIVFSTDKDIWGEIDYWATPLEMLNKGAGDCEDYAIAKFLYLIKSGVSTEKLRLVYVRVQLAGLLQPHMVVAYFKNPTSQPLILDNLTPEVLDNRPDLEVVYSFNQVDIWKGLGNEKAGSAIKRISKWREVLEKIKLEEK